jgi:hypothetical protein
MNTTDVEAALANCRALIDQINAGLSAEEPFVDVSSATELLFYLNAAKRASWWRQSTAGSPKASIRRS